MTLSIELLFVHIPKCGGLSIEEALAAYFGEAQVMRNATIVDYLNAPPPQILQHKVLAGHVTHDAALPYLEHARNSLIVFRNPLSRLRSLYNYFRMPAFLGSVEGQAAQTRTFLDWLSCGIPQVVVQTRNQVIRQLSPESFWNPEFPAHPDLILKAAIRFVRTISIVGTLEDIQTVETKLEDALAIKLKFPHLNRSLVDYTRHITNTELFSWYSEHCSLELQFFKKLGLYFAPISHS